MRHAIRAEIDVEAPPAEVWRHLVDLAAYPEWNPFLRAASGVPEVGQRLTVRMQPPGGRAVTLRPRVTQVVPGATFEWLGHLGVPGLFDGRHRFQLTPTPTGTHLTQSESFSGLLVRPLRRWLDGGAHAGFEAMNAALRRRALEGHPAS